MSALFMAQGNGPAAGVIIGLCLLLVVVALVILIAKLTVVGNPSG